jgi:hypothetical protein
LEPRVLSMLRDETLNNCLWKLDCPALLSPPNLISDYNLLVRTATHTGRRVIVFHFLIPCLRAAELMSGPKIDCLSEREGIKDRGFLRMGGRFRNGVSRIQMGQGRTKCRNARHMRRLDATFGVIFYVIFFFDFGSLKARWYIQQAIWFYGKTLVTWQLQILQTSVSEMLIITYDLHNKRILFEVFILWSFSITVNII